MAESVTPFLMFEGKAGEAMDFYTGLIPDSRILSVDRYGPDGPGPEGSIRFASFSIKGQRVLVSDSYIEHGFTFTPSFSFFIETSSVEEIDALAAALGEGGETLMPLDNYGFSQRFTWVVDRFGVSWQLNLA